MLIFPISSLRDLAPYQTMLWQSWIDQIMDATELWIEKTTKSGKTKRINMRDRLFELEQVQAQDLPLHPWPERISEPALQSLMQQMDEHAVVIRYVGSCRNDGSLLRPSHIVTLLQEIGKYPLELLHIHRNQLFLEETK